MNNQVVAIIGGGAAGFFAALRLGEMLGAGQVYIFEKSSHLLSKVKVSGGGRCNVTHDCFDAGELTKYYPRGQRELRGPFSRFGPADIVNWFDARGVTLKTEDDGRMFPETDRSQTIIDTFLEEAEALGIRIQTQKGLVDFEKEKERWLLRFSDGSHFKCDAVFMAPGSSVMLWDLMKNKDVRIVAPVPSLFTFHVRDKALHALSGLSVPRAEVTIEGEKLSSEGPLLITHWGFSGPAILKLSSFGARILNERKYKFRLNINFIPDHDDAAGWLASYKSEHHKKHIGSISPFTEIPKRLWLYLLGFSGIGPDINWADLSKSKLEILERSLASATFNVDGKSTFKDEFVTSGGVDLKEVNFTDFSCKKIPGLFFGGEFLDVDAVTGGFNFQHAWTSGYLAAEGIVKYLEIKEGA